MLNEHIQSTEMIAMPRFKSRLKTLMLEKSLSRGNPLTQSELARETGLSYMTIQRFYDTTFDRIDAKTLYALEDYFNCKFEDLIERAE